MLLTPDYRLIQHYQTSNFPFIIGSGNRRSENLARNQTESWVLILDTRETIDHRSEMQPTFCVRKRISFSSSLFVSIRVRHYSSLFVHCSLQITRYKVLRSQVLNVLSFLFPYDLWPISSRLPALRRSHVVSGHCLSISEFLLSFVHGPWYHWRANSFLSYWRTASYENDARRTSLSKPHCLPNTEALKIRDTWHIFHLPPSMCLYISSGDSFVGLLTTERLQMTHSFSGKRDSPLLTIRESHRSQK